MPEAVVCVNLDNYQMAWRNEQFLFLNPLNLTCSFLGFLFFTTKRDDQFDRHFLPFINCIPFDLIKKEKNLIIHQEISGGDCYFYH